MRTKTKQKLIFLIPLFLIFSTACAKIGFGQKKSELSSFSPPPEATQTPIPNSVTVKYPSYAKIDNAPILYTRSEIFINTQPDQHSCQVSIFQSLIESGLCNDLPDFCTVNNSIPLIDRSSDYTCAQAYRADQIHGQKGSDCASKIEDLQTQEKDQINDPKFYKISSDNADTSGVVPDPATTLPMLNKIGLDKSCRCHYISNDTPTFQFSYPALETHCRSHFGDVYQ